MILLSVVIPTYGRLDSLKRTLAGLAQQTLPAGQFEVVVVDDGSPDDTRPYLAAAQLPFRLVPIFQENKGPAAARNHGVACAQGDLIVFLDDDVVPAPQLLREHVRSHQTTGPRAVVIGPMLPPPDFMLSPWVRWSQDRLLEQYRAMEAGDWAPTARQFYTGNASLARNDFLEAGGFDARFRRAEDVELAYRLAAKELRLAFSPLAIGYHYEVRSFAAWLAIPYAYGLSDVVFTYDKQQTWLMPTILYEFYRRPWFVRFITRCCLDRPRRLRLATTVFYWTMVGSHRLNWSLLVRLACSSLFNLHHYQGIADGLGGSVRFFGSLAPSEGQSSRSHMPGAAPVHETH